MFSKVSEDQGMETVKEDLYYLIDKKIFFPMHLKQMCILYVML